jgi:hypothetical protein
MVSDLLSTHLVDHSTRRGSGNWLANRFASFNQARKKRKKKKKKKKTMRMKLKMSTK